jgi:predicted Zn-ribbon and HTH transcriptional regulator
MIFFGRHKKQSVNIHPVCNGQDAKDDLDLSSIGEQPKTVYGNGARNINACPHCGFVFDTPPTRGRNCPECKQHFLVRAGKHFFNSDLLTDQQAHDADCFELFEIRDITIDEATKIKNQLAKKWGKSDIDPSDLLWALYNYLPGKYVSDPDKMLDMQADRDYVWAYYLHLQGKDASEHLRRYNDGLIQLMGFRHKQLGESLSHLYIHCRNCCATCNSRDGKRISVTDVTKHQPLPFKDCTNKFNNKSKYAFCRATYIDFKLE